MKIPIICIIYLLLIGYNFSYSQLQSRKTGQESTGENLQFKFHDNAEGTSMMPITGDVLPLIQYIEDSLKMEIVRLEYDLIFPDKVKYSYRTLYKGFKYGIIVLGDYRIKRINISLFAKENDKWTFFSTSKSNNYIARIDIEPFEMKEYRIEIKAEEYTTGSKAGHYSLIIYH